MLLDCAIRLNLKTAQSKNSPWCACWPLPLATIIFKHKEREMEKEDGLITDCGTNKDA